MTKLYGEMTLDNAVNDANAEMDRLLTRYGWEPTRDPEDWRWTYWTHNRCPIVLGTARWEDEKSGIRWVEFSWRGAERRDELDRRYLICEHVRSSVRALEKKLRQWARQRVFDLTPTQKLAQQLAHKLAQIESIEELVEPMHLLLREHGWERAPNPHMPRMWFWTKPGNNSVEFITHQCAFPLETLGSSWRWRIEEADFEPGGTCIELGKRARDRRRHTVASLRSRLEQLAQQEAQL
jgi:hypothetical protein